LFSCFGLVQSLQEVLKTAAKKGTAVNQKTAAKPALVHTCPVCRVSSIDATPKTFKQHSDSKHPKSPMVPVLVDVQA
uniref:Uncharacterized protein n=1 Tax=Hucho hucho TaxID=62062 RepID=A0A4W5JHA0_9TELE